MQLEQAAVEYAAGKLHQVKKARGLPTLSAVFLRGNIFSENWADQLGGPFDCVHVGGSCARERIYDLMRLVKEGVWRTIRFECFQTVTQILQSAARNLDPMVSEEGVLLQSQPVSSCWIPCIPMFCFLFCTSPTARPSPFTPPSHPAPLL